MPASLDDLRSRAQPWLSPISADAPSGKEAKLEPAFEAIAAEVAKLESLTGGTPAWDQVVEQGNTLVERTSKDLRIATYVAYGLYATQGLDGLAGGLVSVAELMQTFWPTMWPAVARIRGRTNALAWLVGRIAMVIPALKPTRSDRDKVEALSLASKRLVEVARERFGNDCPAMGPMTDAVERLRASVPEDAAPPPPPPPPPPQQSSAPEPSAPPQQSSSATVSAAPVGNMGSAADATGFLRQVGTSLIEAASTLRRASATDPTSYRILRTGLWIHLTQAPGANGKSQVPPLAANVRTMLEKMASNQKWAEVLEEAESAMAQFRFALDLQHVSAQALAGLGDAYKPARQALIAELATLFKRMPALLDLQAADGSPLLGPDARAWVDAEVLAGSGGEGGGAAPVAMISGGAPAAGGSNEDGVPFEEARTLLKAGKAGEAIALLQHKVTGATSGRYRFKARLALAKLCVAGGNKALGRTLYESLDAEALAQGLDTWDPGLSSSCLEGLLGVMRANKADLATPEFATRSRRLAQIDPVAVLRLGL